MQRLREPPSQMPEDNDEDWWRRILKDRDDAVNEIERLVMSRNKWAARYNKLLEKTRKRQAG